MTEDLRATAFLLFFLELQLPEEQLNLLVYFSYSPTFPCFLTAIPILSHLFLSMVRFVLQKITDNKGLWIFLKMSYIRLFITHLGTKFLYKEVSFI